MSRALTNVTLRRSPPVRSVPMSHASFRLAVLSFTPLSFAPLRSALLRLYPPRGSHLRSASDKLGRSLGLFSRHQFQATIPCLSISRCSVFAIKLPSGPDLRKSQIQWKDLPLEKSKKFLNGHGSLLDDRFQGPTFKILVMKRDGDAKLWLIRMFQDVMSASGMMNKKSGSLQSSENSSWFESRQSMIHTTSSTTLTFSFTGSSRIDLSGGMGTPSFCRLSR